MTEKMMDERLMIDTQMMMDGWTDVEILMD